MESILNKHTLTTKQQTVFEFIRSYIEENRCSPLIREIQQGCEINSYKSAIDRLTAIERKGFIRRTPNKHRSIKIIKYPSSRPISEIASDKNQSVDSFQVAA